MKLRNQVLAQLACFAALSSAACYGPITTKTVTKTKTKGRPLTTKTFTTIASGASVINGDGNPSYPFPNPTTTVTIDKTKTVETTTITITETPTATTPGTTTSTYATFPGFLPVQDTLPDGSFWFGDGGPNPVGAPTVTNFPQARAAGAEPEAEPQQYYGGCTTTKTTTKTKTAPATLKTTTTLTGTVIVYPSEGVSIPYSSYHSPTTTKTKTKTVVTTSGITSTYVITTASTTTTVPATTVTVYAACGPQNEDDSIIQPNGEHLPIDRLIGEREPVVLPVTDTAYDCCVQGLLQFAGAYQYQPNRGCLLYYSSETDLCKENVQQSAANFTALYSPSSDPLGIVVGNGQCGRIVNSAGDG